MSPPRVRPAMLTWALRYALGRHSYAVGDVIAEIGAHLRELPDAQLDTIGRDLTEHIARADAARAERTGPPSPADLDGAGYDRRWADLLGDVFAELARRRAQDQAPA